MKIRCHGRQFRLVETRAATQREWVHASVRPNSGPRVVLTLLEESAARRLGIRVCDSVVQRAMQLAVDEVLQHSRSRRVDVEVAVSVRHLRKAAVETRYVTGYVHP